MNGKFLLDTNIIIAVLGEDDSVQKCLAQAEEVFISSVALGELYFGACKSKRIEDNLMRIDEFASGNTVLVCDTDTARNYGLIKNQLRKKGKPIPENDIWIASIARQYDLVLVTRDDHFSNVDGLKCEEW